MMWRAFTVNSAATHGRIESRRTSCSTAERRLRVLAFGLLVAPQSRIGRVSRPAQACQRSFIQELFQDCRKFFERRDIPTLARLHGFQLAMPVSGTDTFV